MFRCAGGQQPVPAPCSSFALPDSDPLHQPTWQHAHGPARLAADPPLAPSEMRPETSTHRAEKQIGSPRPVRLRDEARNVVHAKGIGRLLPESADAKTHVSPDLRGATRRAIRHVVVAEGLPLPDLPASWRRGPGSRATPH